MKIVRLARVLLVASASCLSAVSVSAQASATELPEIETVGTGERRVAPDRAIVHLQIESKLGAAAEAAALNSRVLQRVRDTLKALGYEDAVSTASYNVSPDYEPQPRNAPVQRGYAARTVLRVQLAKISEVGKVIDAALAKGATGVDGVMFESSAMIEARRGALADAAAAARADADALAKAMGGTLGPLLSTSTAAGNDMRRANVAMRSSIGYGGGLMSTVPTQITPNEIVISAGVVARWRFIPAR